MKMKKIFIVSVLALIALVCIYCAAVVAEKPITGLIFVLGAIACAILTDFFISPQSR